jgi:integrase
MQNFTKSSVPCLYVYRNGQYYGRKKIRGRIEIKALGTTDFQLAKRKLKEWSQGLEGMTGEVRLKPLCDLFLETRSNKQPKTIQGYQRAIRRLLYALGENTPAHGVKPVDISKLFARSSQDYAAETHNHLVQAVNAIFELAFNNGYVAENPVKRVEKRLRYKKVERGKPHTPTQEQFERLVNHIRNVRSNDIRAQSSDLVEFLGLAAMGEAEALSLRWQDIDWDRERIHVQRRKTGEHYHLPFFPWLRPFMHVLWNRYGKPTHGRIFSVTCAKQSLRNGCKALRYPNFSPRNLRQFGIQRQIRAGLPVKLVSKFQGHQDGGQLILSTYTETFSADDEAYEKKLVDSLKA